MHEICKIEEFKAQNFTGRRRFVHYFSNSCTALTREDWSLLAKSSLDVNSIVEEEKKQPVVENATTNQNNNLYSDYTVYSEE